MTDLLFVAGKANLLRVRIMGKRAYFINHTSTGQIMIEELSKILDHMANSKLKPEERAKMKEDISKMRDIIKEMESQEELESYVIKEIETMGESINKPMGFKLIQMQKPGHRPVFVKSNRGEEGGL